jgi:hypothetical protein
MVKDGVAQSEITKKFGFNTSTQLKVAYTNALMEASEIPEIQSSRGEKPAGGGQKGSCRKQAGQSDPSHGTD